MRQKKAETEPQEKISLIEELPEEKTKKDLFKDLSRESWTILSAYKRDWKGDLLWHLHDYRYGSTPRYAEILR